MNHELTNRELELSASLHPTIRTLFLNHRNECLQNGIQIRLTDTLRDSTRQRELYALGRDSQGNIVEPGKVVTHTPPGRSWHNYGLAYDVCMVTPTGRLTWDDLDLDADGLKDWIEIGETGERYGLEWGGRWKRIRDCPHFEYHPGLGIMAAWAMKVVPPDYFRKRHPIVKA